MTTLTDRTTSRGLFRDRSRAARASLSTVPIVIASSLAMSMNLTGPIALDTERATDRDDSDSRSHLRENVRAAFAGVSAKSEATASVPEGDFAFAAAPATYTVKDGDSVSGIAGRFGLSTATVLAMNGLGWKSIIHPGQVLVLSKTAGPVVAAPTVRDASAYTIAAGDTVSGIASKFGISAKAVLAANGLSAQSIIYPGQKLTIPGSSSVASATPTAPAAPATNHAVVSGETATSIAQRHGVSLGALLSANGLTASSTIYAGQSLVIPSVQPAGTVPAAADVVVPMTPEMAGHARTIVSVGRSLGVDDYGLVIAL